jgi:hypothetical protein
MRASSKQENRHCLPTWRPGNFPQRASAMTVGLETLSHLATSAAEQVSSPAATNSASVRFRCDARRWRRVTEAAGLSAGKIR